MGKRSERLVFAGTYLLLYSLPRGHLGRRLSRLGARLAPLTLQTLPCREAQ